MAVISLSAERRPKQIRIPSRADMGMEKVSTLGRMQRNTRPASFKVMFS